MRLFWNSAACSRSQTKNRTRKDTCIDQVSRKIHFTWTLVWKFCSFLSVVAFLWLLVACHSQRDPRSSALDSQALGHATRHLQAYGRPRQHCSSSVVWWRSGTLHWVLPETRFTLAGLHCLSPDNVWQVITMTLISSFFARRQTSSPCCERSIVRMSSFFATVVRVPGRAVSSSSASVRLS